MNSLGIYGGTGVPARARDRRARWPAVKSAKSSIAEKSAQEFLRSLRERNTSPHTIKAYSGDLQNFCAYVGSSRISALMSAHGIGLVSITSRFVASSRTFTKED